MSLWHKVSPVIFIGLENYHVDFTNKNNKPQNALKGQT